MSKKQIEISKLMDSYTDDEFNIEGTASSARLSEVRNRVMEQVKNKKPLMLSKKLLIIAAAVVGLTAITAAVLPYGIFNSQTGSEYNFGAGASDPIKEPTGDEVPPYTVTDGRVYFTVNGENIDITDEIGEDKFFFYQYNDVDNQGNELICLYAVCREGEGNDDLCYGEYVYMKNKDNSFFTYGAGHMSGGVKPYCYYKNGEIIMMNKDDPDYAEKRAEFSSYPHRNVNKPWLNSLNRVENEWYKTISEGKELDVSKSDTAIYGEERISEWMYPKDWTGEYVPEDD